MAGHGVSMQMVSIPTAAKLTRLGWTVEAEKTSWKIGDRAERTGFKASTTIFQGVFQCCDTERHVIIVCAQSSVNEDKGFTA